MEKKLGVGGRWPRVSRATSPRSGPSSMFPTWDWSPPTLAGVDSEDPSIKWGQRSRSEVKVSLATVPL